MAVKLRLARMGRRHRPFFRINAVDSRTPRDGKIIERLGHFDPLEKDVTKQIVLKRDRIEYWLGQGAVPSDTVSEILLRNGIKHKYAEEKAVRRRRPGNSLTPGASCSRPPSESPRRNKRPRKPKRQARRPRPSRRAPALN